MENEILSRHWLLPSSRKLCLGGRIAPRWDIANKTSCAETCVMKWQGSTNISDVIARKNDSQEAAPSTLNEQKPFSWELQFVSESVSQALKSGERTIRELAASLLFQGRLRLNRFRWAASFFIPVSLAEYLCCGVGKGAGDQIIAAGFCARGTRQNHSRRPLARWRFWQRWKGRSLDCVLQMQCDAK